MDMCFRSSGAILKLLTFVERISSSLSEKLIVKKYNIKKFKLNNTESFSIIVKNGHCGDRTHDIRVISTALWPTELNDLEKWVLIEYISKMNIQFAFLCKKRNTVEKMAKMKCREDGKLKEGFVGNNCGITRIWGYFPMFSCSMNGFCSYMCGSIVFCGEK